MSAKSGADERAGCLKAWLILLLLVLGIGAVGYFYAGVVLSGQSGDAGRLMIFLSIAFSIGAAGASTLLAKRKLGFYLLVLSFVGAGVLQLLASFRLEIAVLGVLNVAVLYWLVQPAWSRLE